MTFIQAQKLARSYTTGIHTVQALYPLDLSVDRDEFMMILGPSGSGKTTLLNLLAGMDSPSEGTLRVDDVEVSSLDRRGLVEYRRHRVGLIFQFFNLINNLTALENVSFIAELVGGQGSGSAQDALESVGLGHRHDHFPHELSGGEQQRVAIARALVKSPPLLLADEPTGNLDAATGQKVLALLQEVHRKGQCVVMVTHNQLLTQAATRVLTLKDGKVRSDVRNENPTPASEIEW